MLHEFVLFEFSMRDFLQFFLGKSLDGNCLNFFLGYSLSMNSLRKFAYMNIFVLRPSSPHPPPPDNFSNCPSLVTG